MKFKQYHQNQTQLFPQSIEEIIPKDHVVRVINKIVESFDFQELYDSYSEEGQPAYHPKMLIKVLIYGYTIGIRTSRKIGERLKSDAFFMYLTGMQYPDFRTISDFRKDKGEYFKNCFLQVLEVCKNMSLFNMKHIAIDGSKIKANASRNKTFALNELEKKEKIIERILQEAEEADKAEDKLYGEKTGYEVPEELRDEEKLLEKIKEAKERIKKEKLKKINMTDPDARMMKKGDGGFDTCYNTQLAVDGASQIITVCDVKSQNTDNYLLPDIYPQIEENTKEKAEKVSADAGYYSGEAYRYIEKEKIDAYVPTTNFEKEYKKGLPKYDRRNFRYIYEKDEYICPGNKVLKFCNRTSRNKNKFKVYKGVECLECKLRSDCIAQEKTKYRQININDEEAIRTTISEKLKTKEGREIYNQRIVIIEPVFAQLKYIMGFNRFLLRGLEKAKYEFNLICLAYNIKKIAKLLPV